MNTITIELCAEDRARLDAILEALKGIKLPNCEECAKAAVGYGAASVENAQNSAKETTKKETPTNTQPETEKPAAKAEAKAHPVENPFPEPVKEEPAPDVQLSDIQSLVVKLATSGKKAETRDIVKAYAERVTEIPAEKFGEVFTKLKALEG